MPVRSQSPRSASRAASLALGFITSVWVSGSAAAAPIPGFIENFSGTSLGGFSSLANVANPGTGGANGAGDGYLRISTAAPGNLGAFSQDPHYVGNWQAAGITQVRLWLNDVDTDDALEIHVSIGSASNLWQYNVGFLPPLHQWAEFIVDLNSANWTRIIGAGTFAQALQGADRMLIRHDLAPYVQTPNTIQGDVGVDRIQTTNATVGVTSAGSGAPRALQLAAPTPNPSRGTVTLGLDVFERGTVRVEVVDIGGRIVHTEIAATAPGHFAWSWDGRDEAGRPTPAGYYRVRAIGASGGASRALVRVQ